MLRTTKEIFGYEVKGYEENVGKVDDLLFMDKDFLIRYLVVNIGPILFGRKVLISPVALGEPDWVSQQFPVNLTKEQIKESPDIKTDQPISELDLDKLHTYYRWPKFWAPLNPRVGTPTDLQKTKPEHRTDTVRLSIQKQKQLDEPKLRSVDEIIGYDVLGNDGVAGKVEDVIIDDQIWKLHYLVVNTGSIFSHKKVLLAIDWIDWFRHRKSQLKVDIPVKMIQDSPEFDPEVPMTRRKEEVYYDFHGKPYYWVKR